MSNWLSEEQIEKLIMAIANGQEAFTEDDCKRVVNWAENIMLDYALLENVLMGRIFIDAQFDELVFLSKEVIDKKKK